MPSNDDRFDGDDCYIKVNPSGGYFFMHHKEDTSEIHLVDIANAISRQCRFTGHLLAEIDHYSVGEHCVLVTRLLKQMGASVKVQFYGLMHDAPEAYLSDIAAPFKRELGSYYEAEAKIEYRIRKKYSLHITAAEHKLVKKADWIALWIEARQIICRDPREPSSWKGYETYGKDSEQPPFWDWRVDCWDRKTARDQFLINFARLQDEML